MEKIEDCFPDGMRVLAVDNDLAYLKFLEASLRICNYEVTTVNQAKDALQILRENSMGKFGMVIISDALMNGFQLQQLAQELDLPVVMVTSSVDNEVIKKGILQGAFCYLVKPVTIEVFKTIWQHVYRNKSLKNSLKYKSFDQDKVFDNVKEKKAEENVVDVRQRKDKIEDEDDDEGDRSTQKKFRLTWTEDMKNKFEAAYNQLGPENAIPSKILALMKVEGLTRSHVASHLQKYRDQHDQTRKGIFNSRASHQNYPHPYMSRITPVDDESAGRRGLWNPNQIVLPRSNFPNNTFLLNPDQLRNMDVPVQQTHVTPRADFYVPPRVNSSNTYEHYRSSDFRGNVGYNERWQQAPMQGYDQLIQAYERGTGTYPTSNINLEHHHRQGLMQTKIERDIEGYIEGYLDDYNDQIQTYDFQMGEEIISRLEDYLTEPEENQG